MHTLWYCGMHGIGMVLEIRYEVVLKTNDKEENYYQCNLKLFINVHNLSSKWTHLRLQR